MRAVGEKALSAVPTTKKPSRHFRKIAQKREIEVSCHQCGYVTNFSSSGLRTMNNNKWTCKECRKDNDKEVNQAIINLAKRKGLIK